MASAPFARRASPARGVSSRRKNAAASDDDMPPTEWEPREFRRAFTAEDSEEHSALAQFMRDAGSCLAGTDTRFIVIGDAILETVAPFPATPRFAARRLKRRSPNRAPLRDPKTPFFAVFVGVLSFAFISRALVDAVVRLAGVVLGSRCVRGMA